MMRWFGTSWGSSMNEECEHVDTPVGTLCVHCEEPICLGDRGIIYSGGSPAAHIECFFRGVLGGVAHIEHRCSCYVKGSTENDPPGLSEREAARAAVCAAGMRYLLDE